MSKQVFQLGQPVEGTYNEKVYEGWYIGTAVSSVLGLYLIELHPRHSEMGHDGGGDVPKEYVKHRKGKDHFFWVYELKPVSQELRSPDESLSYKSHKSHKTGAQKVGKLWITQIDETPKK